VHVIVVLANFTASFVLICVRDSDYRQTYSAHTQAFMHILFLMSTIYSYKQSVNVGIEDIMISIIDLIILTAVQFKFFSILLLYSLQTDFQWLLQSALIHPRSK
jgi:hypothetical protein